MKTVSPPFWVEPIADLFRRLDSSAGGLSTVEASRRLAAVGPNVLRATRRRNWAMMALARLANPLILLLLGASAIAALTGDVASSIVVLVMALASSALDSYQEHRAYEGAERLKQSVAIRVSAMRDGVPVEVPAADLAPGDVILLSAGSLIPADGRVLEARDCFVNQALLTGEPYPVEKRPDEGSAVGTGLGDAVNGVFMGSSAVSGSATVLLCRTGSETELGAIGTSLSAEPPPTAFERGTRRFGFLVLRLAALMVLFVILVNIVRERPLLQTFLFAVALAVGLTPELLPMIVSVTLARGAMRMAAKQVIVKRLAAIHDLGSMDVLCTDKTGTLTEARIRLEHHLDPSGRDSARVLQLSYLNSRFETGLKSPLDDAILAHSEVDVSGWAKIDEVPFDFERRRVSVLLACGDQPPLLVIKGALEDVLRLSDRYEGEGPRDIRSLDDAMRASLVDRFASECRQGFRVLGIGWKELAPACRHVDIGDEAALVFAGFAAFLDPPKTSAAGALTALAKSGVAVKVVTGDSELVTQHVAGMLGIPVAGVLTGAEIARLSDPALEAQAEHTTLFCRVAPAEKNRIILALKRRGHVVGYLGDGINDAPSIHSADVGISVDSGVDVAKAAADLILLRPDLGVLHEGVREGRRTFGNIMKYVMMASSSNFGNMLSMAGASVMLPFLPMLPSQILLNNFLYDVSEIPIPMDEVDDDMVRVPRQWDIRFIARFMLVIGTVSSIFDFLTFGLLLRVFRAPEALFQTGWFMESLATQVLVIFVIRTRGNPLRSRISRVLAVTSLGVVALATVLPFLPLASRLGFVPPPLGFFVALGTLVIAYLSLVQVAKTLFYRRMAEPVRVRGGHG